MPPSSNIGESELLHDLIVALHQVPQTQADIDDRNVRHGNREIDAIVDVTIAGCGVRLAIECKNQAFPRDISNAVRQLRDFISAVDNGTAEWLPMIAAGVISPGGKEMLRDQGVAYFDSGGSLYVPAPGAFLYIDKPMAKRAARKVGGIFRGRRAQVLHAVWELRHQWFGGHQIADLAHVARATASETLTALERHGWVVSRGSGPAKERRLEDARGLLDAWTDYQRKALPPRMERYFVPAGHVQPLMLQLDRACEEKGVLYEATGEAAGQEYAPYLSSIHQLRCRMLAGSPAEAVLRAMDARRVDEGWNLGVIEADNEGAFALRQRGQYGWLASPLQTYLDLLQGSGRSHEMAQHLREERLQ